MNTNCQSWARCFVIAAIATLTCLASSQDILAQGQGGGGQAGGGGGAVGGGQQQLQQQQIQQQQLQQQQQAQSGGGTGGDSDGGGLETLASEDADLLSGIESEDVRNQGFVGATGNRIQEQGFVGPPGESSAPPLADGASFGGGVNDSATGGGGGAGRNVGGNRQTGFGAFGQAKGFQVIRKGVRTRLSPRFASPSRSTEEVAMRFSNRIQRQPVIAFDGGGLSVEINQRVATVTGFAQSEAERNRFIRQLRLEPGIDRVVDQVSRE